MARGSGPKAGRLKGLSHEMHKVGKVDAVLIAEGNIVIIDKTRISQLSRDLRPWRVTHSYDTVTRETLSVLQRRSMADKTHKALGNSKIHKIFNEESNSYIYQIRYTIDNCNLIFMSDEADGSNSSFSIHRIGATWFATDL